MKTLSSVEVWQKCSGVTNDLIMSKLAINAETF